MFSDKANRCLYFDKTDTAHIVVDGVVGMQLYNAIAPRDSSATTRMGAAAISLLAGNWAYNSVLRDAVQAVLHPADAVKDAVLGHGTIPGDMLVAGGGYAAYKGGSSLYGRMKPPPEEGIMDVVEDGAFDVLESLQEILQLAPLAVLKSTTRK